MLAQWFLCALAFTGSASQENVCSYQDVLDHLNLTKGNEIYTSSRPVRDWRRPTVVHLDIYLYAILAVIEKSQIFTPFIWTLSTWNNEFISWDPSQFCGISKVFIPKDMVWKPDLFIFEVTEEDDGPHSPYLSVSHDGTVTLEDDYRVVSTCKMDVYKFPFDTQSCVITFGSSVHTVNDLRLIPFSNSSRATQNSLELIQTQGEWEFLNMSVKRHQAIFSHSEWDLLKYTITVRRRPLLHVINFLLPILFFLTLDIASFFISDVKGEKLGFKVTVLLAISVLLLILNDILPSMSNKTPLIATFCIVIFAFMLLSLLETILVTYLMELDSALGRPARNESPTRSVKTVENYCMPEFGKSREGFAHTCPAGTGTRCGTLPLAEQVSGGPMEADSRLLLTILAALQELREDLRPCAKGRGERRPRKWEQAAKRINAAFLGFYVIAAFLFLVFLFTEWMS